MESRLPHPRRTIQTNGHVLQTNELPRYFSNDDEHHLSHRSRTRLVICIHGRYCSSCYDTTGSPSQQESGGACAILRMTLSRADLVLVRLFRVRSVRQRKAVFPWLLNNSLKGLILKQEIEDREERGMRIGLQYD